MIVLHIAPMRWGALSGLSVAIPNIVKTQNELNDVTAGLVGSVHSSEPQETPSFYWANGSSLSASDNVFRIADPLNRPDVVIFHSTYILQHARIARLLKQNGIPYIITPHGGLTEMAILSKRWKKRFGNWLFLSTLVNNAAAIHFLSDGEAADSTRWKRPSFVVGNGSEMPDASVLAEPGRGDSSHIIYLGRLSPFIKGLDLLVDACATVKTHLANGQVTIDIYGPNEGREGDVLGRQIRERGLEDVIRLRGPVFGPTKNEAFRSADVFVLTSRSEGHPIAALEAMAHGIPCFVTPGTRIGADIVNADAGWLAEPTIQGIAETLVRVLAEKPRWAEMGSNARQLAVREFSWETVAERTIAAYQRVLESRDRLP